MTSFNTAKVISAIPVSQTDLETIKTTLKANAVLNKIDKELIGGFKIIFKGQVFDYSLLRKLSLLRDSLSHEN